MSEYLQEPLLDHIGRNFEVVDDPDLYGDRPHSLQTVAYAEAIIIRNRTMIDTEILAAATELKMVADAAMGDPHQHIEGWDRQGSSSRKSPAGGSHFQSRDRCFRFRAP